MNQTNSPYSLNRRGVRGLSAIIMKASVLALTSIPVLTYASDTLIDTATLSIAPTGVLNLQDNDLIVRTGSYATIVGYITTGLYNGVNGYWDGPGINSSFAAANALTTTALGIIDNSVAGYGAFPFLADGSPALNARTLAGPEILVKYTYFGDADLNGVVDADIDYNQFLAGLGGGGEGWLFGDFDYSGGATDDGSDYNQFLLGLNGQTSPLVSQGVPPAPLSQVPEPTSIGMLLFGAVLTLGRRVRHPLS